MKEFDARYRKEGFLLVAGVDEAGRGPLAGPVVSAAVILKEDADIPDLNDSKKLTEKQREKLFPQILAASLATGIGIVGPERIDEINILRASLESMVLAVKNMEISPDFLLVDGKFTIDFPAKQKAVIGGDGLSASIAAASILAKVTRDHLMGELDLKYPGYGLAKHKGYPTKAHREAISRLGVLPIHRKTFRGVAEYLS